MYQGLKIVSNKHRIYIELDGVALLNIDIPQYPTRKRIDTAYSALENLARTRGIAVQGQLRYMQCDWYWYEEQCVYIERELQQARSVCEAFRKYASTTDEPIPPNHPLLLKLLHHHAALGFILYEKTSEFFIITSEFAALKKAIGYITANPDVKYVSLFK